MNYDVNDLIKIFESIPEEKWCINTQDDGNGRHCAFGHLRYNIWNCEAYEALDYLSTEIEHGRLLPEIQHMRDNKGFGGINNGNYREFQQPTPKQRTLAALYDIRDREINSVDIESLRPLLVNHKNLELV